MHQQIILQLIFKVEILSNLLKQCISVATVNMVFCTNCGQNSHSSDQYLNYRICFKCKSAGHLAKNCKNEKASIQCNKCGKSDHCAANCIENVVNFLK